MSDRNSTAQQRENYCQDPEAISVGGCSLAKCIRIELAAISVQTASIGSLNHCEHASPFSSLSRHEGCSDLDTWLVSRLRLFDSAPFHTVAVAVLHVHEMGLR